MSRKQYLEGLNKRRILADQYDGMVKQIDEVNQAFKKHEANLRFNEK